MADVSVTEEDADVMRNQLRGSVLHVEAPTEPAHDLGMDGLCALEWLGINDPLCWPAVCTGMRCLWAGRSRG
jgi:hypothetical protein